MKSKSMRTLLVVVPVASAALAVGAARADVSQTPVATTCPASFGLQSVAWFEARGPYRLPRLVDTAGNDNGYVCALQMPDAARDADCRSGGPIACLLEQLGLPLYRFTDDDNPAADRAQAHGQAGDPQTTVTKEKT